MKMLMLGLLVMGISLDSFAVMTCRGAMLPRIDKAALIGASFLFGIWQALVYLFSNSIIKFNVVNFSSSNLQFFFKVIAVLIFCGLGVYMLWNAVRNKIIYERRLDKINPKDVAKLLLTTSICALLAGMGLAFIKTDLSNVFVSIILVNILAVILGVYTGYHQGYQEKTKAYTLGGIVLLLVGMAVLLVNV